LAAADALLSRWEQMVMVAYLRTYVNQTSIPGSPFYMLRMAPLYTRGPAGARNFVRRATCRLVERFYINLWTKDAFTPNIQWVIDPALNTAENQMVYLQIRARFDI
jgi:hypothetical protein